MRGWKRERRGRVLREIWRRKRMRERLVRRRVVLRRLVPIEGPFASRAGICSTVGAIPLEGRLLIWSEGVTLRRVGEDGRASAQLATKSAESEN